MRFSNKVSSVVSLAMFAVGVHNAAQADVGLNACIGSGVPDISDGRYECRNTDIVPNSFELGQHVHLDWQSNDGDEIVRIEIDFGPSANTDVKNRGAFFPDYGDGANVYNAQRNGNFFSAEFTNFDDSVDNLYLGFNLDKRVPNNVGNAPVDPDLTGTTISVETQYGRQFSCSFHHVDFSTAYAGRALPVIGNWMRMRWMLPCQELPLYEVNPEVLMQLQESIRRFEVDFCENNPDSAMCSGDEKGKK